MSNLTGMPANVGTRDNPVWGVKMKQPANPGDVVSVVSKDGKARGHKRLISVHKQWPDAVDWVAEDADSDGGSGATGPGQSSPAQFSGSAPAPPSFSPGPTAGVAAPLGGQAVTASSLVDAQLAVRARLQEAGCSDEQAMASYANTIVIAIQKGAAHDLVDFDPFSG